MIIGKDYLHRKSGKQQWRTLIRHEHKLNHEHFSKALRHSVPYFLYLLNGKQNASILILRTFGKTKQVIVEAFREHFIIHLTE
jgi:hypothetical protein